MIGGTLYNVHGVLKSTGQYIHLFTWRGFKASHADNMMDATKRAQSDSIRHNMPVTDITVTIAEIKEL
jgi:hypothetical protein